MNQLLQLPQPRSAHSSLSSLSADSPKEYRMVLLGTHHKQPLFDKMCSVAQKFERHIQYADIWYLTFQFDDSDDPVVVELKDPGTDKTGERQMAIQQKSDAVILCYSAFNPDSLLALESVVEDFQTLNGQAPVTLLLCNEDQLVEEGMPSEVVGEIGGVGDDGYGSNSGGGSSPSDTELPLETAPRPLSPAGRTPSMERIRQAREGGRCPIGREKGEQLSQRLGPNCEFRTMSFDAQLDDQFVLDLVDKLIRRAVETKQQRSRRRNRPARPVASSRQLLSPSPLKHILRRKTSNIKRRLLPQSMSKTRERTKTTTAMQNEEGQQQQQTTALTALATTSSQDLAAATSSSSATEKANGAGTVQSEQQQTFMKKPKSYVSGVGAMLKTFTHPRERVRVGASKEEENAVQPVQSQNAPMTADSARVNNFMDEKGAANERQHQRAERTRSFACTIQ
uniref:Ras-like protein family member 12 n=1 Tax=Globodera pallida TaxID=36090 RepID=A0A183C6U2_GLOPA